MHRSAAAAFVFLAGCFEPSPEAVEGLKQVTEEAQATHQALEDLEERLLGNQARVHHWTELAERHRQVSAVACENQNAHADQMVALRELQEEKAKRLRRGRFAKPAALESAVGGPEPEKKTRRAKKRAYRAVPRE